MDTTNPTVTVNSQTTNNRSPDITGTMSDTGSGVASVSIMVGANGPYTATLDSPAPGQWTAHVIASLGDGLHEVVATVTDNAGNTGTDATTNELRVDATNPVVTVTAQLTSSHTPTIAGTVTDGGTGTGIAHIRVTVNGNTYSDATAPAVSIAGLNWSIAWPNALPDGTYDVAAAAEE